MAKAHRELERLKEQWETKDTSDVVRLNVRGQMLDCRLQTPQTASFELIVISLLA